MQPLELEGFNKVRLLHGKDEKSAGQEILNFLAVLGQLSHQPGALAENLGRVRAGKPPALGLLHHAAVTEFSQSNGGEHAADFLSCAKLHQPAALFRHPAPGIDKYVRVNEQPNASRDVVQGHRSKTSTSMLLRNCSRVSGKSGADRNRRKPAAVEVVADGGASPLGSRIVSKAWAFGGSASPLRGHTRPSFNSTSTVL